MNRTVLLWLSLILSIVGIITLFFLKPDVSPQYLQMTGEIMGVDDKGKVTFLTFVPDDFLVVSFKDKPEPGTYTLTGRLQQYKGRVEFVVEKLQVRDDDIEGDEDDDGNNN